VVETQELRITSNAEWLSALRDPAAPEVLEELRRILLRGLRAALNGRVNGDVNEISEDFAQEALLKILNSLDTFRGESRFTTWAQKIAIHVALSELRRRRWRDIPLQTFTQNEEGEEFTPAILTDGSPTPDNQAARQDALRIVHDLIFHELTDRQRDAMLSIVQDGIPLREVAERLETNPNALYKLMHDARQRLRQRMQEKAGLTPEEVLALFETQ
jgi:RNA polymerase sigma-70 factor (ECF subfamily)